LKYGVKLEVKSGGFEGENGQLADHVNWQEKGTECMLFPPSTSKNSANSDYSKLMG
jgi:hypothetical protein